VRNGRGPAALATVAWLAAAGVAAAEPSERHFVLHCQGCHRADGSGAAGAVPSLVGRMGRFLHVPGGRAYLVQVPGTAQAPLDDEEIAALLNWMLATFSPAEIPEDSAPFDAAEVGRHRAERSADVGRTRRALLRLLDEGGAETEAER
jgi:mono/diheme cytochrome c family protein